MAGIIFSHLFFFNQKTFTFPALLRGCYSVYLLEIKDVVWNINWINMYKLIVIGFILLTDLCFGQNLKSDLTGDWICRKIIDSTLNETSGKFGHSSEFLKFSFYKSKLRITEAPFDQSGGIDFSLTKKDSIVDLFPGAVYEIQERKYKIKLIDQKNLVLETKNLQHQSIYYVFIKQNEYSKILQDSLKIDCGTIIIRHLKLDLNRKGVNRVGDYYILRNESLFYPTPYFKNKQSGTFSHYFSINFSFPENYPLDSVSNELIVEFDVTESGVKHIEILTGIDTYFDQQVYSIIKTSSKFWKPVEIEDTIYTTRMKLHFYFYFGLAAQIPINFK